MLQEELEVESQWKIYRINIRNTNLSVKKKIYKIEVPQKQGVFDPEMDLLTKCFDNKRYCNQEMTCWEMTVWDVLLQ